jgi:hypothetical protein
MRTVCAVAFPPESALAARLGEASFHDAFETDLVDGTLTPIAIAYAFLRGTPAWAEALLSIRNRMVAPFGVRDIGRLSAVDGAAATCLEPGDPLSFFTVHSADEREVVLGIDDTHLNVRIAIVKRSTAGQASYVIASWVRTHNSFGRLYMVPVGPMHKLIVRAGMRSGRL